MTNAGGWRPTIAYLIIIIIAAIIVHCVAVEVQKAEAEGSISLAKQASSLHYTRLALDLDHIACGKRIFFHDYQTSGALLDYCARASVLFTVRVHKWTRLGRGRVL